MNCSKLCAFKASLAAAALLGGAAFWILLDPGVPFLAKSAGAEWILPDKPPFLGVHPLDPHPTWFRTRFAAARPLERAVIRFKAMRSAALFLDGKEMGRAPAGRSWKRWAEAEASVPAGGHEIAAMVVDESGPPAFLLRSPDLGLATGTSWEFSFDGAHWGRAAAAQDARPLPLSREFPSAGEAMARAAPLLAPIFLLAFLLALPSAKTGFAIPWTLKDPRTYRFLALGFWTVLALNNTVKLPWDAGFDVPQHTAYVRWLVEHRRIPLPSEGWQMFQSPLYYVLCAPLYALAQKVSGPEAAGCVLRLACWASAVALVEMTFLALRRMLPGRGDLQSFGMAVGGFLPMNLYRCQSAGNEPLAAALTAAAILAALRLGENPGPEAGRARLARDWTLLGIALGLALLAKATPILLVPPLAFYLAGRRDSRRGLIRAGLLAAAICGLYYGRNWWIMGSPFIGGWDPARKIGWWQEPGYRVLRHVFFSGESLMRPVYASWSGFWDGFYSTLWLDGQLSSIIRPGPGFPWNVNLMLSGAWLGLVPTILILTGFCRSFARSAGPRWPRFAAWTMAVYLAALFALFMKVPIYSAAKASYTMGLTPFYAGLAVYGFDALANKYLRAGIVAAAACYAVAACGAYFIW